MSRALPISRRALLGAFAAGAALGPRPLAGSAQPALLRKPIPSTGELLPAIGLGTWITFNVGEDPARLESSAAVMRGFFAGGGGVIDSSPMYGSSQATVGHGLAKLGAPPGLFAADKVWTAWSGSGPAQIEQSRRNWAVARFDLLQVHNLLGWEAHLPRLLAMKAEGRVRYVGITTSEGRRHAEIERIMRREPIDFVQVTYNPLDREVEARILPLAAERGIAVLANRPFREGPLVRRAKRRPLPDWAAEIDCADWAQLILKFIVSHPAVTCAIPATTRVQHVQENLGAMRGRQPDAAARERIAAHLAAL